MIALAGAASAQGFSFDGAELSYTYYDSDDAYDGQNMRGSVQAGFGAFGAQLDIVGAQLDIGEFAFDGEYEFTSVGLHLNYAVNDNLIAGVFIGQDDWRGARKFDFIGAEAKYSRDAYQVELAAGTYSPVPGTPSFLEFQFIALDGEYDFGNGFTALGGVLLTDNTEELTVLKVGTRYEIGRAFIEASVSDMSGDYDHRSVGLEIGYTFGGSGEGITFEQRDFSGIFGLY